MPWAPLDDGYHSHPKTESVSLAASGLWVRALSYCAKHLTDGRLPAGWVRKQLSEVPPKDRDVILTELLEQVIFERNGAGYYVHDYLDHNPSRAQVLEKRRKESERKAGRKTP